MGNEITKYDCAIVGGGLAGLCLAIQMVRLNHSVVIFEKNDYPFHKVCGEYISNESWDFLESLGLPLSKMNLPIINQLGISSTQGFMLESPLKMGGFGISRFTLDYELSLIARKYGVVVMQSCKVNNVDKKDTHYLIDTAKGLYSAKVVCGSFGKHNPLFIEKTIKPNTPNYIGIKYHIKTKFANNKIELHNFKDGYCGVSKVDGDKYCLCYLTTSKSLNDNNNDVKQLEEMVLYQNPFLKSIFLNSEFLYDKPLTISQIVFNKKSTYSNHIFLLGDAAGAIAPLCGNGMSMGMRASKLLTLILNAYLQNEISEEQAVSLYEIQWNQNFSKRIKTGYYLQQILGKNNLTHMSLKLLNTSPKLLRKLITLTHGQTF
jgi:flavin-dependent dehydrogenase